MAITITSEQIYLAGKTRTTPQGSGSLKYCEAGYAAESASYRYVTLYTCNTTTPLTEITFSAKMAGQLGTDVPSNIYLGVYVTTSKLDKFLTDSTVGINDNVGVGKLAFSYTTTNEETPIKNGSEAVDNIGITTVNKSIPAGSFYVYIVPYSNPNPQEKTYSTFYSSSSSVDPVTITGKDTGWELYKCYIDNGTNFEEYECYVDTGSGLVKYYPFMDKTV